MLTVFFKRATGSIAVIQCNCTSQTFINLVCFWRQDISKYLKVMKLLHYALISQNTLKENIATIQIQFFWTNTNASFCPCSHIKMILLLIRLKNSPLGNYQNSDLTFKTKVDWPCSYILLNKCLLCLSRRLMSVLPGCHTNWTFLSIWNIYYCSCDQNNVQKDFKGISGAKFLQRSILVLSK